MNSNVEEIKRFVVHPINLCKTWHFSLTLLNTREKMICDVVRGVFSLPASDYITSRQKMPKEPISKKISWLLSLNQRVYLHKQREKLVFHIPPPSFENVCYGNSSLTVTV